MMFRWFSLIVPVGLALVAVSSASAQPRQEVGPWSTMERVGEALQDRQERRSEVLERIEEAHPNAAARRVARLQDEEPVLLSPLRVGGWPVEPLSIEFFGPVASADAGEAPAASTPTAPVSRSSSAEVVPYQPLVLGSLFGGDSTQPRASIRAARPTAGFRLEAVTVPSESSDPAPAAPAASPKPAPAPAPAPSPKPAASPSPKPAPAASPKPSATHVPAPAPAPAPAPTPQPAPAPAPEPGPQSQPTPPPATASLTPAGTLSSTEKADAFLNFSKGPFPASRTLAVGTPDAWYRSPVVTDLLGRAPTETEKHEFKTEVLSKVEESFRKSGLDVDLTIDPGPAAHTLSVVSGALAVDNAEAIGIADIGGDGFTFIDNFTSDAIATMDDLETAIANNISHELMHAFGVDYHDETGTAIDSGRIAWDLLTSDDLAFSDEAVRLLSSRDFQSRWDDVLLVSHQAVEHGRGCSCHPNGPLATPEPAALTLWTLALVGAACSGYRWKGRRA